MLSDELEVDLLVVEVDEGVELDVVMDVDGVVEDVDVKEPVDVSVDTEVEAIGPPEDPVPEVINEPPEEGCVDGVAPEVIVTGGNSETIVVAAPVLKYVKTSPPLDSPPSLWPDEPSRA